MRSAVAKTQLGNRAEYSESSGAEKDHKKIRNVLIVLIDTSLFLFWGKVDCLYFRKLLF